LKRVLVTSVFAYLFFACGGDSKYDDAMPSNVSQPIIQQKLNTEEGHLINVVTSDSIRPLINSVGDTIALGEKRIAHGMITYVDSVEKPESIPFIPSETVAEIKNGYDIVFPLPQNTVDFSQVETFNPNTSDTIVYVVNSTGDSIKTLIPIACETNSIPCVGLKSELTKSPILKESSRFNVQVFDVEQGLNSPYMRSAIADSKGNLWFGSEDGGIGKYDGTSITYISPENGLPNNTSYAMMEDSKGNIWLGTWGGGLCKYDGRTFSIISEETGLSHNHITALLEDTEGNIWIGTVVSGLAKYDGKSLTHYGKGTGIPSNRINYLYQDSKGSIWIGTSGGGMSEFDGEKFKMYNTSCGLQSDYILSINEDAAGTIWFGTNGDGVISYDRNTFTHYSENINMEAPVVTSVLVDTDQNIWAGTNGSGVYKICDSTYEHYSTQDGLSSDYIRFLIQDNGENIWMGTSGGGNSIIHRNKFKYLIKSDGISGDAVETIIEDPEGKLWFGTDGGGLSSYDGENFVHYNEESGLISHTVPKIIYTSKGDLWANSWDTGLVRFDGERLFTYSKINGLINSQIRFIEEDLEGNLWLGTRFGVVVYNGETFVYFSDEDALTNSQILCIYTDSKGNVWLGSRNGLTKFDGEGFTAFSEGSGLSNNVITCINEDADGNLWIGTNGGGINVFDGETFTYYTEKNGLSHNLIRSIEQDDKGQFWVTTEKGMNLLVDADSTNPNNVANKRVIKFGKEDGVKGLDFYASSSLIDSKNNGWWGGGNLTVKLDVDDYKLNEKIPEVSLKQIDINEEYYDFHNLEQSDSLGFTFGEGAAFNNYPSQLELEHYNNHLAFHYGAIEWGAPHKLLYSYRIVGLDTKWSTPSVETKADYRNIPFGDYTFEVRAIGESQQWSEPLTYSFSILPPWWHTWWARGLYLFIGLFSVFMYVRWKTLKMKKRQKELETEVKLATAEILSQKKIVELAHVETEKQKEEIEKQHEQLEEVHQEITDSITYAKRLQDAILPSVEEVNTGIDNNFIYFKPKDIVSGDFYWFEKAGDWTYIAAADCTGHGVPGALVSVVCSNALNRSLNEFKITDPSKILDKTRELVIKTFAKSGEGVKDGMDIALVAINGNDILFAGANNPLWVVRKTDLLTDEQKELKSSVVQDDYSLIEYKASKQPVGLYEGMTNFVQEKLTLVKGDVIYLFSDGFPDQFGGLKGKKFKYKPFKNLLISMSGKPMSEQKSEINGVFNDWKGDFEQIDDVCIIGVRV